MLFSRLNEHMHLALTAVVQYDLFSTILNSSLKKHLETVNTSHTHTRTHKYTQPHTHTRICRHSPILIKRKLNFTNKRDIIILSAASMVENTCYTLILKHLKIIFNKISFFRNISISLLSHTNTYMYNPLWILCTLWDPEL